MAMFAGRPVINTKYITRIKSGSIYNKSLSDFEIVPLKILVNLHT